MNNFPRNCGNRRYLQRHHSDFIVMFYCQFHATPRCFLINDLLKYNRQRHFFHYSVESSTSSPCTKSAGRRSSGAGYFLQIASRSISKPIVFHGASFFICSVAVSKKSLRLGSSALVCSLPTAAQGLDQKHTGAHPAAKNADCGVFVGQLC